MRWSHPYIAVLTIYCMIPGAGEVIENVAHLVETGHTAHALDDEEHERQGAEHGCSGTLHVCSCCQSPAFVGTKVMSIVSRSHPVSRTLVSEDDDFVADGYLASVFRPPIV